MLISCLSSCGQDPASSINPPVKPEGDSSRLRGDELNAARHGRYIHGRGLADPVHAVQYAQELGETCVHHFAAGIFRGRFGCLHSGPQLGAFQFHFRKISPLQLNAKRYQHTWHTKPPPESSSISFCCSRYSPSITAITQSTLPLLRFLFT